jgi:hypothetical protein
VSQVVRNTSTASIDMSSGLPDERDFIVAACPDVPKWSENLLFTLYDPDTGVAVWLHLGTVPDKWTMWEDRVLVMLPGHDGALSLRAYHHTAPERRPAGPGLDFSQVTPWRRWHVSFDGFGLHTPESDMLAGVSRDGPVKPFTADLDVELLTPAWDARTAAKTFSACGVNQDRHRPESRVDVGERRVDLRAIGHSNPVGQAAISRCDVQGGDAVSVGSEAVCNRGTDARGSTCDDRRAWVTRG